MNNGAVRLVRWRRREKLSQEQAAHALGVSVSLVSKLESGARTPSLAMASAIEEKTGISASLWTKLVEAAA